MFVISPSGSVILWEFLWVSKCLVDGVLRLSSESSCSHQPGNHRVISSPECSCKSAGPHRGMCLGGNWKWANPDGFLGYCRKLLQGSPFGLMTPVSCLRGDAWDLHTCLKFVCVRAGSSASCCSSAFPPVWPGRRTAAFICVVNKDSLSSSPRRRVSLSCWPRVSLRAGRRAARMAGLCLYMCVNKPSAERLLSLFTWIINWVCSHASCSVFSLRSADTSLVKASLLDLEPNTHFFLGDGDNRLIRQVMMINCNKMTNSCRNQFSLSLDHLWGILCSLQQLSD